MKQLLVLVGLFSLVAHHSMDAATYYTRSTGDWTGNIWGTTTTGTGAGLPALNNGDIIYIDDDITITTNLDLGVDVTIIINATLTISGQLKVGAGSVFQFSSAGTVVNAGPGNSAKIVIGPGPAEWSGNDNDITGPGSFDNGWSCCALTLPVKLQDFTVAAKDESVILNWITVMEENFMEFIVQRSSDGLAFEDIGKVKGKGFDIYDIASRYSFEDASPLIGFNYYRLKAVDLDETHEYFGVKAVKISAPQNVAIYPNPSSGNEISLSLNFSPDESATIILLDQRGLEILRTRASTAQSNISFENKLRPGVYMLRYISGEFEKTTRIIVKN